MVRKSIDSLTIGETVVATVDSQNGQLMMYYPHFSDDKRVLVTFIKLDKELFCDSVVTVEYGRLLVITGSSYKDDLFEVI